MGNAREASGILLPYLSSLSPSPTFENLSTLGPDISKRHDFQKKERQRVRTTVQELRSALRQKSEAEMDTSRQGTPLYLPPEHRPPSAAESHRSDEWQRVVRNFEDDWGCGGWDSDEDGCPITDEYVPAAPPPPPPAPSRRDSESWDWDDDDMTYPLAEHVFDDSVVERLRDAWSAHAAQVNALGTKFMDALDVHYTRALQDVAAVRDFDMRAVAASLTDNVTVASRLVRANQEKMHAMEGSFAQEVYLSSVKSYESEVNALLGRQAARHAERITTLTRRNDRMLAQARTSAAVEYGARGAKQAFVLSRAVEERNARERAAARGAIEAAHKEARDASSQLTAAKMSITVLHSELISLQAVMARVETLQRKCAEKKERRAKLLADKHALHAECESRLSELRAESDVSLANHTRHVNAMKVTVYKLETAIKDLGGGAALTAIRKGHVPKPIPGLSFTTARPHSPHGSPLSPLTPKTPHTPGSPGSTRRPGSPGRATQSLIVPQTAPSGGGSMRTMLRPLTEGAMGSSGGFPGGGSRRSAPSIILSSSTIGFPGP
eukprot:jgi/Mesvir1/21486/Mv03936-RA.1